MLGNINEKEEQNMNFENYMNPPILDDLPEQIETEVAKKKKYKDVIVGFDQKTGTLSVDIYWGKANYAVYAYDNTYVEVRKAESVEKHKDIKEFVDKEDIRILKILELNHDWVLKYYEKKS